MKNIEESMIQFEQNATAGLILGFGVKTSDKSD
jgi:hypothetical protein